MKKARLSLRLSLSSAFVLTVVLTALTLGLVTFFSVKIQMRGELKHRLADVVIAASLSIDAQTHSTLQKPEDMDGEAYKRFRDVFARLKADNPDIRFLYTFRQLEEGKWAFVMDSGTTEEDFSPLGSIYEDSTPALAAAFTAPYRVQVDDDFYEDEWGVWLSSFAPILHPDGTLEAVLGLDMSASKVIEYEMQFLFLIAMISLAVSILGAMGGIIFSRRISQPLLELAEDMAKIQRFDLEEGDEPKSRISEVVVMTSALENMKKGLRSFKKYVPADVVAQLIGLQKEAVLETSKKTLTIFFSDLENFTSVSENLRPEDLSEVLGDYFDVMTRTLQKHHATVDKFIGDAIMAFWGAPLDTEDPAGTACLAALDCQRALRVLHQDWRRRGIPVMRTRIGINTGETIVGNVGYEDRLSFTALGDSVNLASRLEGLNKYYGTSILIGEKTWAEVAHRGLKSRWVDKVAVKGKAQGIDIFELFVESELPPDWSVFHGEYEAALELYRGRSWEPAARAFDAILARWPEDGPSKILSGRCRRFLREAPSEDWDGVTVMVEK